MSCSKAVVAVLAMAVILSCSGEITGPDVGPNQVGFINNARTTLFFGARFQDRSLVRVGSRGTAVLPYYDTGYYIALAEEFSDDVILMDASPGQTIEAYRDGDTIKARIK